MTLSNIDDQFTSYLPLLAYLRRSVLVHIPDAQTALTEAVRVCRRALLLSMPSRPDDNPEHIHLFDEERLRQMLADCEVNRVKCDGVSGHLTVLALK